MHSLWWLQSPGIITCNSVLVPVAHAITSMLELAPRFIFLVQAKPFICKQDKCIQFRQHHILMNIRIFTKKRKYLVIQLERASFSNWSSMYTSRGYGCNNGIDVLIKKLSKKFVPILLVWLGCNKGFQTLAIIVIFGKKRKNNNNQSVLFPCFRAASWFC